MRGEEWPILLGDLGEETKSSDLLEQVIPSGERKEKDLPEEIPILPLEDNVLFPEIALPWVVHGENWVRLVHEAVLRDKIVGVLTLRKKVTGRSVEPESLYEIGVVGKISRMLRLPEEAVQILVFGLAPFIVKEWVRWEPYPVARVEVVRVEEVHTDEVDKIGADFRGDPASALLEVLDPEQNEAFIDHYLGVPFNLSRVLFIATANVVDTIPPALLDRMEVIFLSGYTDRDKLTIARRYLIPRQCRENGLSEEIVCIPEESVLTIIRGYTREAGVRQLERSIAAICRKVAKRVASGESGPFVVDEKLLREFLGPQRHSRDALSIEEQAGVAIGLAWTEVGGEVLFVETVILPGKGNLVLTGNMGKIMQESARIVLSCVRERTRGWNVAEDFYEKNDIHIHVPAGAIPKDGPSAGITMAVSLVSALTKTPPRQGLAMTGEVTLTGRVLPVGGIKEKILAAHRAGIKEVLLPKENGKDLEEIPRDVQEEMCFRFVENIDEVLTWAFGKNVEGVSLERRSVHGLG